MKNKFIKIGTVLEYKWNIFFKYLKLDNDNWLNYNTNTVEKFNYKFNKYETWLKHGYGIARILTEEELNNLLMEHL